VTPRLLAASGLAAAVLGLGCPGRPRAVVYDLAARAPVAETWSEADVLRFGTPAAEPRLVDGYTARPAAPRALPLVEGGSKGVHWDCFLRDAIPTRPRTAR
jgi:hypothetical protein